MTAPCDRCGQARVAALIAKCADRASVWMGEAYQTGYVPPDMGIGDGDYVRFAWCLACGKIQGRGWPLPPCALERQADEGD